MLWRVFEAVSSVQEYYNSCEYVFILLRRFIFFSLNSVMSYVISVFSVLVRIHPLHLSIIIRLFLNPLILILPIFFPLQKLQKKRILNSFPPLEQLNKKNGLWEYLVKLFLLLDKGFWVRRIGWETTSNLCSISGLVEEVLIGYGILNELLQLLQVWSIVHLKCRFSVRGNAYACLCYNTHHFIFSHCFQCPFIVSSSSLEWISDPSWVSYSTPSWSISFCPETRAIRSHTSGSLVSLWYFIHPRFAFIFNRSYHWSQAPSVPISQSSVMGDRSLLKQAREIGSIRLHVNQKQLEEVMRGSVWKNQHEAANVHAELDGLRQKEQQLWRRFCGRFGVHIGEGNSMKKQLASHDRLRRMESGYESKTHSQRHEGSRRSVKSRERDDERRRECSWWKW